MRRGLTSCDSAQLHHGLHSACESARWRLCACWSFCLKSLLPLSSLRPHVLTQSLSSLQINKERRDRDVATGCEEHDDCSLLGFSYHSHLSRKAPEAATWFDVFRLRAVLETLTKCGNALSAAVLLFVGSARASESNENGGTQR